MIDPDGIARSPKRQLRMLASGGPVERYVIAHGEGERTAALNRGDSGQRPSAE